MSTRAKSGQERILHRAPHFVLPQSFDPFESLPSNLHRFCDDARYFISTILRRAARGQVDEDGNVRLMAAYLRRIMDFRNYYRVVDALLEDGVVVRTSYLRHVKAFGYQLSERFINDRHVRVTATDKRLIRRFTAIEAECERERRALMQPVHLALERHQLRLSVDLDQAREILGSLPAKSNPWDSQSVLIGDIAERHFHLSVGTYGRVSNSVSCLKRELRSSLRVDKHRISNVDIRCCQPALLGKQVQQAAGQSRAREEACNYDVQMAPDLVSFIELVQSGRFYEFLVEALRTRSFVLTREDVKQRFLTDVLAKRGNYPSIVEDVFRECFPTVYHFIRYANKDGSEHANLVRLLQRAESDLVILKVAADLARRWPRMFMLTLHDSIFVIEQDIPLVVEAFEAEFKRSGYAMSLKVE